MGEENETEEGKKKKKAREGFQLKVETRKGVLEMSSLDSKRWSRSGASVNAQSQNSRGGVKFQEENK